MPYLTREDLYGQRKLPTEPPIEPVPLPIEPIAQLPVIEINYEKLEASLRPKIQQELSLIDAREDLSTEQRVQLKDEVSNRYQGILGVANTYMDNVTELHSEFGMLLEQYESLPDTEKQSMIKEGQVLQRLDVDGEIRIQAAGTPTSLLEAGPPDWLEKTNKAVEDVVTAPLFTILGVPISATDIVGIGLLAYIGVTGGKSLIDLFGRRIDASKWQKGFEIWKRKNLADKFTKTKLGKVVEREMENIYTLYQSGGEKAAQGRLDQLYQSFAQLKPAAVVRKTALVPFAGAGAPPKPPAIPPTIPTKPPVTPTGAVPAVKPTITPPVVSPVTPVVTPVTPAVPEVIRMTREEFIANPPKGFVYDATLREELLAHRGIGKTTVGNAFFKLPTEERLSLLRHEEGHDLIRNFNRDWKDVLEPTRKDPDAPLSVKSRYDNPFGASDLPEEIVADAYTSLWQGSTKWFEDPNFPANKILRQVIEVARREGKPLPSQNEIQFVSEAKPLAVEVVPEVPIAKMGTRYVFNLKQFRFEPKPFELPAGTSPEADKLTNLVKLAKPVRELTEALKHEELAKRVGVAAAAAKATGAQKAAFAAMAKLKGELPTATFTPPEAGLTEVEITGLYNQVKTKLLIEDGNFFKWLNTDTALRKLLAGKIPTRGELEFLEDMFGSELIKAVLAKRPLSEKAWELTLDILNIPKAILASGEFSAWFRQGAFITTAYPKIGAKALAVDFRTFFSGKYTAEIDANIKAGKFAKLREDAKLYLSPISEGVAIKLAAREEMFMSRLVKKIPIVGQIVRWSERAYLSTLNYMRASTFDQYATKWEPMGYSMQTYKQLATLINWATGRGPIGKAGSLVPLLNGVFFAARLQTSRAAMLFGGYKFTSPPVRRAYIRMMLSFFGSVGAIVALLDLTGVAKVEKDPRSTDFGKIRIGNTRLDPWAGFKPFITLFAQLISGERKTATGRIQEAPRLEVGERAIRSKYAPAFGLLYDILKGETFLGEEMSLESESLREQFYQRLMPLWYQDTIDAVIEEGWLGGFLAAPGAIGVGVVTYPGSIDAYERHVKDIPEEMLMDWQRGIAISGTPLTYRDLNTVQKSWLRRYTEEIGDEPERREVGRYSFYEAESATYEELGIKLNEEIQPLVDGILQGKTKLEDYITQTEFLTNKYFGSSAAMWRDSMREKLEPTLQRNLDKWHEDEIKPEDKLYEEYIELRANPPLKNGVPDWEAWSDKLKGFLSIQTVEIKDYIQARRENWINNLPEDRQVIERLILDAETVLNNYYAVSEGDDRLAYRDANPEVDARLVILRGLKPRTNVAQGQVLSLLGQYGIPVGVLGEDWLGKSRAPSLSRSDLY